MTLQGLEGTGWKARMAKALVNLAVARQVEFTDESQRVYLHLLADLDAEFVAKACEVWAVRQRGEFTPAMPTAGDLRATVADLVKQHGEQEKRQALRALPAFQQDEDAPRYYCLDCLDEANNWRFFWCPGSGKLRCDVREKPDRMVGMAPAFCGRKFQHGQHSYVVMCACASTNPVTLARREREQRKRAEVKL